MSTVYVTYYVPAADRDAAEAAVAPYLSGPGEVFTRPLVAYPGDPAAAPPTHFGGNASMSDQGSLYAALSGLAAAFPGSNYAVTPFRQWNVQTKWVGWLATNGLQPQALTP